MLLAFISDVHFGKNMEDLKAWNFALKILADVQPDEIILGGDIYDHEAVGRHRKKPESVTTFQSEIDHGYAELLKLRETCPNADLTYYRGNHERRVDSYLLDIAKPLYGLEVLDPINLYKLDSLGIKYIAKTQPFKRGHLWIAHGDEFATGTANPANRALDDLNSNILFGHVHRVSTASRQQLDKRCIVAWSNSCLCRLDPGYTLSPEWTQGFTLVDFTQHGYFSVTPVVFWFDAKKRALCTVLNGNLYDSRAGH